MNARRVGVAGFVIGALLLGAACADEDTPSESEAEGGGGNAAAGVEVVSASGSGAGSSAAVAVVSASAGGFAGTSTPAQLGLHEAGLTVVHVQRATVPADRAFVVVYSGRPAVPPGPASLSPSDRSDVLARLGELGIAPEDVAFDSDFTFGLFPSVRVAVPLADLRDRGPQIEAAIEDVIGRSDNAGARFGFSDCARALEGLRRDAFAGARDKARGLADAADVTLGSLTALSEGLAPSIGGPSTDPCEATSPGGKVPGAALQGYDAPPEVETAIQVTATFALDGAAAPGLTVDGAGHVTARSDEAYVLAWIPTFYGPAGPNPIDERDRADLLRRLGALGIAEGDIEFSSPGVGGPTILSVRMDPARVAERGEDIIDEVEDVFGRVEQRGAYFTHSNCLGVLAEAQKQALVDAKARVDALARAAGLRVGGIAGVATNVSSPYGPVAFDPCSEDFAMIAYGGPGLQLKSFDAEPLVEIRGALRVTYAVEP